jgi:chemotaxis protein MotA
MLLIVGYIIILASAVGTYSIHGSLASLWMPTEYLAIFGLLIGAFVGGNTPKTIKSVLGALPNVFKGSRY